MGRMSRNKGAAFERKVAGDVVRTLKRFGATRKSIYRTPLSGGHPFGDSGDLVVAPELRRFFPFVVECKHWREWKPEVMFSRGRLRAQEHEWVMQVVEAAGKTADRNPLLVMRGQNTPIYAAIPEVLDGFHGRLSIESRVCFFDRRGKPWVMLAWAAFLRQLTLSAFLEKKAKKK